MKDLKRVVDAYLGSRVAASRARATYIGDNGEVLGLLSEKCDIVDGESLLGGCDILVLDGEPESFQHLVSDTELIVYIGPNTQSRDPFRNIMDWDRVLSKEYGGLRTPQDAFVYSSSNAILKVLDAAFAPEPEPEPAPEPEPEPEPAPEPEPEEDLGPLDDPAQPVNTTPSPRDFFTTGP